MKSLIIRRLSKDMVSSWRATREDLGLVATVENLKMMLRQEDDSYSPCEDYLYITAESFPDSKDLVNETWRRKICEWAFEVVDHYNFDREAVAFALSYLDRTAAIKICSSQDFLSKRDYQLLAVTSLYLAIKLHGVIDDIDSKSPPRKLSIRSYTTLSRESFREDVIEQTELEILSLLKWRVHPPTYLRLINTFLRLCPRWSDDEHTSSYLAVLGGIYDVARYLSELALCISSFSVDYKASVTAYAAVLCAIEALQPNTGMQLPYKMRLTFLNNIGKATGLFPSNPDVGCIYGKLKQLAPGFFTSQDSTLPELELEQCDCTLTCTCTRNNHDDEDMNANDVTAEGLASVGGKSSPVCVLEAAQTILKEESPGSRRKRSRSKF
jgi:hypothetical protein